MDPILRRRLVGAAVLWAGAMVLLPWVLDRKPAATEPPALVTGGDPEREMRTIDLAPPPLREATPTPTPVQSPPPDAAEIPAPVAGVPAMPEPPPNEDEAASVMPERPAAPAQTARKPAPEAKVKPQAPAA